MGITNPFSVVLFTNRTDNVQRVRKVVSEHPSSPVWWTFIFVTVLSFLVIPLQDIIQPKTHPLSWHQDIVVYALLLVIEVFGTFFMNGLATWGIHRQQQKSWGVQLPEDEPRVLWFRTGIWVGAATSYALCIVLTIAYVCVAMLLIFVSQHQKIMGTMNMVFGVLSLLYFSYAIAYFYGIPKRLLVFRYVVAPVIVISIIGIALAVVLGWYQQYKKLEERHEAIHKPVMNGRYPVVPTHSTASQVAARPSAMIRYAALLRAQVQDSVPMQNLTKGRPVEGTAVISFRLTPSGHLLSAHIAQSSGSAVINRAALKAVMGTRFPPFIQDMPAHPLTLNVSVHLSLHTEPTVPIARLQHAHHQPSAPPNHSGDSPMLLRWIRQDDAHCLAGMPLSAPWLSSGQVSATVVSFVSRKDVPIDIAWNNRTLHGMLAPAYMHNQRILVHPDNSPLGKTMLAVVSSDMRVTTGESVEIDLFHAFHRMPCTYVPNLIVDRGMIPLSK